ncbi:MAG: hypothetical protein M1815_005720 [Lichina confinis]|nr:MAG: hypothetical protein M1815_005720 [Lichina confinis]
MSGAATSTSERRGPGLPNRGGKTKQDSLCVAREACAGRRTIGPDATNDATWVARPPRGVAVPKDTTRKGRGLTGPNLGIWDKQSLSWWFLRQVVDPPRGRSRSCGTTEVQSGKTWAAAVRTTDLIETAKGWVREQDAEGGQENRGAATKRSG